MNLRGNCVGKTTISSERISNHPQLPTEHGMSAGPSQRIRSARVPFHTALGCNRHYPPEQQVPPQGAAREAGSIGARFRNVGILGFVCGRSGRRLRWCGIRMLRECAHPSSFRVCKMQVIARSGLVCLSRSNQLRNKGRLCGWHSGLGHREPCVKWAAQLPPQSKSARFSA